MREVALLLSLVVVVVVVVLDPEPEGSARSVRRLFGAPGCWVADCCCDAANDLVADQGPLYTCNTQCRWKLHVMWRDVVELQQQAN